MTYRELFYKATRLIDNGKITLGEYEEMTKPLDSDIEQEPSGDLISRQAALKKLKESAEHHANDSREEALLRRDRDIIRALPPVNPQPKTGHWIKTIGENGVTSAVRCSECGFEDNRYMLFRYCPNCGARMVEPQEGINE